LDSGIQANHPALADRIHRTLSRDFTTGNVNGVPGGLQDVWGTVGHGVHVAGIIGGNGTGITGACWGVSLVSLQVFTSTGGYWSYVRYAVDFANSYLIPILNYSGGGRGPSNFQTDKELMDLYSAIDNYPGLFVCAAGNNGTNNNDPLTPYYPANFPLGNLISVGAITVDTSTTPPTEKIAAYPDPGWSNGSNYGSSTVDIFAPGTAIWSTIRTGGYEPMSGTSMATPYVAGVAALVKSLHPQLPAQEIKFAILNNADKKVTQLNNMCTSGGKLDAYSAVTKYISIVGSIDVNFTGTVSVNGTQHTFYTVNNTPVGDILMGRFHLFSNGRWALVERGKLSTPIKDYYAWDYPQGVKFGAVPPEILSYMNWAGLKTIDYPLRLYAPASRYGQMNYWNYDFNVSIEANGVRVEPWGRCFANENLSSSDQMKIRIENVYGRLY
jgi:subtilisin family serine protease